MKRFEFGAGLVSLGRTWGFRAPPVPDERQALRFLEAAVEAGVRVFDTAPAYGSSESRAGKFFRRLSNAELDRLLIATKFGEHWNADTGQPYVDHSWESMQRSIDESLRRLPRIHLLQLHKATAAALESDDVGRAFEYAARCGIRRFGASVSDIEACQIAARHPSIAVIQMPYNSRYTALTDAFAEARRHSKELFVNRPFAMGELLGESRSPAEAYRFILRQQFEGAVLTGTRSVSHLKADLRAFSEALASSEADS